MHKKKLSTRIAEEAIDEIMMAGLAFLLVVAGVNYFNMKWAWTQLIAKAGTAAGISQTAAGTEITNMISSLATTFPFKFLFVRYDFWSTLAVAIALTVIGVVLKALTVKTKGKFVIDIGKDIQTPAVIGFIVIIALQFWTAFNIDTYLRTRRFVEPAFTSGFFVWDTYGQLFLIGAALLVIGAIIKLVGEKNVAKKTMLVGNSIFNGAFMLLMYYFIIRILTLDTILSTSAGKILTLFIISNQFSGFTIIVCVFMFSFGRELRRYGAAMLKHERRLQRLEDVRRKFELGPGQKLVPRYRPEHPKTFHLKERHIRQEDTTHPAFKEPYHPIHRYVSPSGSYKRKRK